MSATETHRREHARETTPPLRHVYPSRGWSGRPDGLGDVAHCGHRRTLPWDGSTRANSDLPPHLCVVCAAMEGLA